MLNSIFKNKDPVGLLFISLTYFFLVYAYYVIVVVICIPFFSESSYGWLNVTVLTFLIFLCVVSHFKASFSNPGYILASSGDFDEESIINHNDELTICRKCGIFRSPDSHHCGICRKCIKKRHHHCPWINNCIGESNQRYFIQFNFYTEVLCIYGIVFLMTSLVVIPDEKKSGFIQSRVYHSVFVIVECLVFGLFVFAIMCEQLTSILSSKNTSTYDSQKNLIEIFKSNVMYKYSQLCKVFGRNNPLLWFLPFEFKSNSKRAKVLLLV
ncbi:Palmitoyltransferase ZDHHC3 [Brachionus plicatilis]|uniref:Palmitoyltransferase n=1 Tax=Brachionus plicatilis TaxID=10195 RepID=A0A3M7TBT6_BRAPC|nr:Palmitoyltransferase ZDHHC3 [Brachionus plicatilis]